MSRLATIRTRLPGVIQTAESHDCRAVGRRGQTDPESGYRDGDSALTKPVGGCHEQDRYFPYDVAEHLRTSEEMAAYLEACLEEADGDAAFIAKALGDIARAKGMAQVACDAGLSRESLYKALSGRP